MVNIPPIEMVMTGGYLQHYPCFQVANGVRAGEIEMMEMLSLLTHSRGAVVEGIWEIWGEFIYLHKLNISKSSKY